MAENRNTQRPKSAESAGQPSQAELPRVVAELRESVTSLTLELEHLRHRVEVLEHNASERE
jgi:hypothetical protein